MAEIATAKKTEVGAAPADHGVGPHDNQDFGPAGPTMAKSGRPKRAAHAIQFWPWPFSFEHGDLLSEGQNFEGGITSTAEKHSDADNERGDEFQHELTLVTSRNVASSGERFQSASC